MLTSRLATEWVYLFQSYVALTAWNVNRYREQTTRNHNLRQRSRGFSLI